MRKEVAIKHEIRKNGKGETKIVRLTPKTAIFAFCKECVGLLPRPKKEIEACTNKLCPLYPFRLDQ